MMMMIFFFMFISIRMLKQKLRKIVVRKKEKNLNNFPLHQTYTHKTYRKEQLYLCCANNKLTRGTYIISGGANGDDNTLPRIVNFVMKFDEQLIKRPSNSKTLALLWQIFCGSTIELKGFINFHFWSNRTWLSILFHRQELCTVLYWVSL